jgi:hypothetical protein
MDRDTLYIRLLLITLYIRLWLIWPAIMVIGAAYMLFSGESNWL